MTRYFFDTHDGDFYYDDDVGVELTDIDQARLKAAAGLADAARDALPDGVPRMIVIEVHDESHGPGLRAAIEFRIETIA